jgi:hypothetical protein
MYEYSDMVSEYVGHELLESGQSITIPHEDGVACIGPIDHHKCHFLDVHRFNTNLFVCVCNVNLYLVFCMHNTVPDVILVWHRGNILYSVCIPFLLVNYSV